MKQITLGVRINMISNQLLLKRGILELAICRYCHKPFFRAKKKGKGINHARHFKCKTCCTMCAKDWQKVKSRAKKGIIITDNSISQSNLKQLNVSHLCSLQRHYNQQASQNSNVWQGFSALATSLFTCTPPADIYSLESYLVIPMLAKSHISPDTLNNKRFYL